MKIGIFDSGLGGLVILKSVTKLLPQYSYVYLGDTLNLPYGKKSQAEIYNLTKKAVAFLFKHDCKLVIIACNTASAAALRKLQKGWLPKMYPDRRILGVIVPVVEVVSTERIGVIATKATVLTKTYIKEIKKLNSSAKVFQVAASDLVPLIEANNFKAANEALKKYLTPLINKHVSSLILGCTHYPLLKNEVRRLVGKNVKIISQDQIIPLKLQSYLNKHAEFKDTLLKNHKTEFYVTKLGSSLKIISKSLFGTTIEFKRVNVN
ncbi:MAG: glutamate racemase [Candidatus Doudnabacteria bacterium]|nr:glutamate racemase [Candidatus Doudnabacteria bacterium]